jgi:hypothetical protein
MVHSSTSTWPIEYANLVKVLYEATPTFLSWVTWLFLFLWLLSHNFSIKGGVKSLPSYHSSMEGDGTLYDFFFLHFA